MTDSFMPRPIYPIDEDESDEYILERGRWLAQALALYNACYGAVDVTDYSQERHL